VLAIWTDVDPGNEAEFNHWYTHQHLPERVSIPGFLRGRRYVVPEGASAQEGAKYFTLYETEALKTLSSPAYMHRLNNPTDWTKRVVHMFRNNNRTACRVTASQGRGIGGYAATIEFGPSENASEHLRSWLIATGMPKALEHPELVGVHLCEADEITTRAKDQTEESKSSEGQGRLARWLLIVESTDRVALEVGCDQLTERSGLTSQGAVDSIYLNLYRLLFSLSGQRAT
jgi:hypothetical protein